MEAYTFRHNDSRRGISSNRTGSVSTRRTLNFNGKYIRLTKMLAEDMRLTVGRHLAFTIDEEKPERIYVRQADDKDDTRDVQFTISYDNKAKGTYRCAAKCVVDYVLQQVGATSKCTCYVSPKPTNINGKDHFQILVACPLMIN